MGIEMFHVEQRVLPEVSLPVGEPRDRLITVLGFSAGEIDGLANQTRRCACLQPPEAKTHLSQRAGQSGCCRFPSASTGLLVSPNVHEPTQEGSGGDHDGQGVELNIESGLDPVDLSLFVQQPDSLALFAVEQGLALTHPLQAELVSFLVALSPRSPNRRPLLGVEHAKL